MKNIWVRIKVFIKDPNKKSFFRILKEVIVLTYIKKEIPLYYFAKFLYRKEIRNFKDFISAKEMRHIYKYAAPSDALQNDLVRNKLAFGSFLKENDINTPSILAYNINNSFIRNKEVSNITSSEALSEFFKETFSESDEKEIFAKPFSEMGGKDCFIINRNTYKNQLNKNNELIFSKSFIYQSVITQHPDINKINAGCINSVRFNSYVDNKGVHHILSAFMRFGRDGNVVDNGSSGGFYVPVDLKTGRLTQEGKQLMRFGGQVFHKHPDTQFNFSNYEIPYFKEAIKLIDKAMALLSFRLIGWDVAITETGPTIIEANENFSVFVADIAYGGYLRHPLFKEIMQKID